MQATSGRLGGHVRGGRRSAVAGEDNFEAGSLVVKVASQHDRERRERQGFGAEAVGIRTTLSVRRDLETDVGSGSERPLALPCFRPPGGLRLRCRCRFSANGAGDGMTYEIHPGIQVYAGPDLLQRGFIHQFAPKVAGIGQTDYRYVPRVRNVIAEQFPGKPVADVPKRVAVGIPAVAGTDDPNPAQGAAKKDAPLHKPIGQSGAQRIDVIRDCGQPVIDRLLIFVLDNALQHAVGGRLPHRRGVQQEKGVEAGVDAPGECQVCQHGSTERNVNDVVGDPVVDATGVVVEHKEKQFLAYGNP